MFIPKLCNLRCPLPCRLLLELGTLLVHELTQPAGLLCCMVEAIALFREAGGWEKSWLGQLRSSQRFKICGGQCNRCQRPVSTHYTITSVSLSHSTLSSSTMHASFAQMMLRTLPLLSFFARPSRSREKVLSLVSRVRAGFCANEISWPGTCPPSQQQ